MTILYPIRYQDSVDLQGDDDSIIVLLSPPQQRMLQSILNNVESNPDIFIQDYFDQNTDEVDEFLAALMLLLMGDPMASEFKFGRQNLHPAFNDGVIGALSWSSQPTLFNAGFYVLSLAINNGIEWEDVALKKGTYFYRLVGRKSSSSGIATLKLNTVSKATIDLYNSTTLDNQILDSGSFTVTADNVYNVLLQMVSKNASSSNYGLNFNGIEIIRTGD